MKIWPEINPRQILSAPLMRVILRSVFGILVCAIAIFYLRGYLFKTTNDIIRIRETAQLQEKTLAEAALLRQQARKADLVLPKFAALLPGEESGFAFPNAIKDLSEETGVTATIVFSTPTPQPSRQISSAREVGFRLNVAGGLSDVVDFLGRLSQESFLVRLDSMTLESASNIFTGTTSAQFGGALYLK